MSRAADAEGEVQPSAEQGSEASGEGEGGSARAGLEPRSRARDRQRGDAVPGRAVSAFYALTVAICLLGWSAYALQRGYPLVIGLVFTTLFALAPLVLIGEGLRYALAQQWGRGAAGLVCGLGLLGYAASGAVVRGMLFPGDPTPIPARLPAGLERVAYEASDGQALAGVLARAPEPGAPLVVFFHGNAESAGQNVSLAEALLARGCHVFLAEFRGFGGLGGSPNQAGLLLDGEAALAAACAALAAEPEQVVLCGRSLGSGVASALASRGRGRKLVLLSPYTSITDIAARLAPRPLAWLAVRDPLDSRAALLARPGLEVLVFHGDRDQVVPYALGQELVAALGGRARLVSLSGVGHNDLLAGAAGREVLTKLVEFARAP